MSTTAAVVLAAGKGTRMESALPKPLVPLAGRALVLRLLDAVRAAGVDQTVVVVGHGADQVRAALPPGVQSVHQAVRDGTASAVGCAESQLGSTQEVFVLVGDSPLLRPQSLVALREHHRATGAACTFLTATFARDFPYARVMRAPDGTVAHCVEARDCSPQQRAIPELLTSHFVFDGPALWAALSQVHPHPITGERYLTDVIGILRAQERRVEALSIPDWRELVGLNTPAELAWAAQVLADG